MKLISLENNYLYFILIVVALEAILFSIGNNKLDTAFLNEENQITKEQDVISNLPIQAEAVSVYDETLNRKIYGKNDEVSLPIASLTKIMTAVISLNNHQMDDMVPISLNAIKQQGDYGFSIGEEFNIKDLAEFTLIGSTNDGAYALAEDMDNCLEKMNEKAQKIGMKNALFLNPTGLDIDAKNAGAYASAEEVNIMDMFALREYPEVFGATTMPEITIKSELDINHSIENTDTALDKIPNILFSKTGFTPLANGNLAIIYKDKQGHDIAITVLGSTSDGRFSDMENMVNALYNSNYGN